MKLNKIVSLLCLFATTVASAQNAPYQGGFADGYGQSELVTPFAFPISFQPYIGGNSGGGNKAEIITAVFPFPHQFYVFAGGANDGWTGNLAPGVVILPLTLFQFTGDAYGAHNKLFWVTQNEQNTSHFIIEKSANGVMFLPLKRSEARGNYAGRTDYQVTDSTPGKGKTFYRIRMIDRDGSEKLSPVIVLERTGFARTLVIFPNPVQNQLQVRISEPSTDEILWTITDAAGRKLIVQKTAGNVSLYKVDIAYLPSGICLLSVQQGDKLQTIQFTKQ